MRGAGRRGAGNHGGGGGCERRPPGTLGLGLPRGRLVGVTAELAREGGRRQAGTRGTSAAELPPPPPLPGVVAGEAGGRGLPGKGGDPLGVVRLRVQTHPTDSREVPSGYSRAKFGRGVDGMEAHGSE